MDFARAASHSSFWPSGKLKIQSVLMPSTRIHWPTLKKIYPDEVARQANIIPNSFWRYFKPHTRKTYRTFLQELRVGYASKLLIENRKNITQVCYESGFNNLTNFCKSFKKVTVKTPLEYQKVFIADAVF
jgi:AraC-like DNA-binding protein